MLCLIPGSNCLLNLDNFDAEPKWCELIGKQLAITIHSFLHCVLDFFPLKFFCCEFFTLLFNRVTGWRQLVDNYHFQFFCKMTNSCAYICFQQSFWFIVAKRRRTSSTYTIFKIKFAILKFLKRRMRCGFVKRFIDPIAFIRFEPFVMHTSEFEFSDVDLSKLLFYYLKFLTSERLNSFLFTVHVLSYFQIILYYRRRV